jgi:ER membrane protein complex subunit 2
LDVLVDYFLSVLSITDPVAHQCTSAINQLTKGRNKEEEDSELQSLAAEVLLKNYKQQAPSKAPLISSMLKNMKLS